MFSAKHKCYMHCFISDYLQNCKMKQNALREIHKQVIFKFTVSFLWLFYCCSCEDSKKTPKTHDVREVAAIQHKICPSALRLKHREGRVCVCVCVLYCWSWSLLSVSALNGFSPPHFDLSQELYCPSALKLSFFLHLLSASVKSNATKTRLDSSSVLPVLFLYVVYSSRHNF